MDINSQFLVQIRNIYESVKEDCRSEAASVGRFSSREEVESTLSELWKPVEKALSDCCKKSKSEQGFLIDIPIDRCDGKSQHASFLSRQQMQEAVAEHYGWEKWSEHPWASYPEFCKWISSTNDDPMAVWAVNNTFGGRSYLGLSTAECMRQFDYPGMDEEDLLVHLAIGTDSHMWLKAYTGWDDFNQHYPPEPLPSRFVNEQIIRLGQSYPLANYRLFIASVSGLHFAQHELIERAKKLPELPAYMNYVAATSAFTANMVGRRLAPEGSTFPDRNQSWEELEQALAAKGLKSIERKYDDIYPPSVEHQGVDTLKESHVTAEEGLFEGVTAWQSKLPHESILAGLGGYLGCSLLAAANHNLIDDARKNKPLGLRMAEILRKETKQEPEQKGADYISEDERQKALKHLAYELDLRSGDTVGEVGDGERIDLKSLALDLDELPPSQRSAVERYLQAFEDGCDLSSKTGDDLKQYFGDDYQNVKKNFSRAKEKLKQLREKKL